MKAPLPHLLMTTDAVGGVWVYASTLATGLIRRDWRVTLAVLGPPPSVAQREELPTHPDLRLLHVDAPLEWQDPDGRHLARTCHALEILTAEQSPDLVHINGFREALADFRRPCLVAAHSCVCSWWRAVHGCAPTAPEWARYAENVSAGLAASDIWIAPTRAFRDTIEWLHRPPQPGLVVHNGLDHASADATVKAAIILSAGRLWDPAKNVAAIMDCAAELPWPIRIAGPVASGTHAPSGCTLLGPLPRAALLAEMRAAAIFVSPALYEPFGLTTLEAAAAGCALVLADIPSFRELWSEAAVFVDPCDAAALSTALRRLCGDEADLRRLQQAARRRAQRYTAEAMVARHERIYRMLLRQHPGASAQPAGPVEAHA